MSSYPSALTILSHLPLLILLPLVLVRIKWLSDDQWDRVFESVADKHPDTDCGVFFCGPAGLGDTLKDMCGKYTSPMGCRFYFGKEVCCLFLLDSGLADSLEFLSAYTMCD